MEKQFDKKTRKDVQENAIVCCLDRMYCYSNIAVTLFILCFQDMSDYDFEGRLNIRIYAALKRDKPTDNEM